MIHFHIYNYITNYQIDNYFKLIINEMLNIKKINFVKDYCSHISYFLYNPS